MIPEWPYSLKSLLITRFSRLYNVFFPSPRKTKILLMTFPSPMKALCHHLFFSLLLLFLDPDSSDTHRTAFCTCWTATNALNQNLSASKTARIGSTWSSPVKRESMTKLWRVRFLFSNVADWEIWNCNNSAAVITISPIFYILFNLCCSSDLNSREQETLQPVHVINVDIQDNHEEATLGAFLICELCQCVSVPHQYFVTAVVPSVCITFLHPLSLLTADWTHRRHGKWNRGAPSRVWGEE